MELNAFISENGGNSKPSDCAALQCLIRWCTFLDDVPVPGGVVHVDAAEVPVNLDAVGEDVPMVEVLVHQAALDARLAGAVVADDHDARAPHCLGALFTGQQVDARVLGAQVVQVVWYVCRAEQS